MFSSFAFAEQKAVLYFSGVSGEYSVGQNINVVIITDPKGQFLDTVRVIINFSKDALQVQSVILSPTFSVADPDNFYSNTNGTISYTAGIPGGINTLSQFATINFLVKKAGDTNISFDGQSIILSGGENILSGLGNPLRFSIKEIGQSEPNQANVPQNIQPKSSAVTNNSLKKEPQNNVGVAALESAAIPIVEQTSRIEFLRQNWPTILTLLLFAVALFSYRKNIFAFIAKFTFNEK
ncbi:MAG: hypothetical protein AAB340_03250 [Patescibacteria group bacterium]